MASLIRRRNTVFAAFGAVVLMVAAQQGCSCRGSVDNAASSGAQGSASGTGGAGGSISVGSGTGGGSVDCTVPCAPTEVCSHGTCVPLSPCTTDDDCSNDTTCDSMVGCVPWDGQVPAHDPGCINASAAGIFSPKIKCEFAAAPPGDPFPAHVDVQSTPVVVNFNKPSTSGPPSIAATFTATVVDNYTEELGVIRVLRGNDCTLEANLGGTDLDGDTVPDWIVSSASLATGDLDGDGVAEIVAYGADGSTLAFTKKNGTWGLLWKSPYVPSIPGGPCDVTMHRCPLGWGGPSIHDLDDDGVPEVLREGSVIRADGTVLSGAPAGYASYLSGVFPVVANLDLDPAVEMTNGQFVWEWQAGAWAAEPSFPGLSPSAPGHVAVADFGAYGTGVPANAPEIAVVRNSTVMIYTMAGDLVQPPIPVPGAGGGGPPTIADFDGDGLPEVGVAGQAFYTVYDIDCGASPRPGGMCPPGTCDFLSGPCPAGGYIAWSRASQDVSSNVTGSSVFDFEADGVAEVVYADECFVRVYNGLSGEVIFSQYHSSCTWYENPIVADVDGNFRADLVTPSNKACSPNGDGKVCTMLDAQGVDVQFPGLRCKNSSECVSGACDAGFCRCTATSQCCGAMTDAACLEEGLQCAAPPAGTPGAGNTCRAAHPHGVSGIRVYSDANDKWVRSRTIWNQHAYAVTHVNEDGTIPATSAWKNNWDDPTLNNFRQNVPGNNDGKATGDSTAGASTNFICGGGGVTLTAPVCNRGADPIAAGLSVGFYLGPNKLCGTTTSKVLAPEECEVVSCIWGSPPASEGQKVDITVVPNDDMAYTECKGGNNEGTVIGVFCKPAG